MNSKDLIKSSQYFLTLSQESEISIQEFQELGKLIEQHSELYYEHETPLISDSEYDRLYHLLKYWEQKFSGEKRVSQQVGSAGKQSSFEKVAHSRPMISLDNTYNADDLRDFDARVKKLGEIECSEYMLEFKFDGLGVELVYQDGNLVQAITRGNGIEGEDITENVKQIQNIPHRISKKEKIEIRGEVVMPLSSFERLNTEAKIAGEKIFSNPRNAASGSLRVLDIEITKKRDLKFFAYDMSDFSNFENGEYISMIQFLEQLGFEISSYFKKCSGVEGVIYEIEHFGDIKKHIDFEIDGLVIKLNNMSLWKKIGYTEHHPRYAIAYKFPAEIVTTSVLSVEHSLGRTGTFTPVANLEPVNIGGAMIRRATLHNYEEVEKLGIQVGDRVFLKRAGEVIPKIISVAFSSEKGQKITPPEFCPSCGTKILKDADKVRYYCPNTYHCLSQIEQQLTFTVGKQGFDIENFGEKQAELFLKLGYIKHISDIFRLKNYRENILELDGFQEKSVNNLLSAIEKVRKMDMVTFLKGIGIPGVGKKTAKTLAKYIISGEKLTDFIVGVRDIQKSEFLFEDLLSLPDIGPEVAQNVIDFFREQYQTVEDLLTEIEIQNLEKTASSSLENKDSLQNGKWQGKKMCITGSFEGYSREDLIKILEEQGGEFMSSVSSKTDYLLAGEKAGSKLAKAQELGVFILNLQDFFG